MLVERRLLSQRQLELALAEQQRTGRRLGEVLVGFGYVSEQSLAQVLLEQVGVSRWWLDEAGSTYVIPRRHDIVVGGTDEEGVWDRTPDEGVGKELLARARDLVHELRGARVLRHRVGLRPARPTVRLEAVTTATGGTVVHCYGHGGAGVTLSWGCADEVASLVSGTAADG